MRVHSLCSSSETWYDINFKVFISKTILKETMWFKKMLIFLLCRLGSELRVRDFFIKVISNTDKYKIIIFKKDFWPLLHLMKRKKGFGFFCPCMIYYDVESNSLLKNLFNSLKTFWLNIQLCLSCLLNKAIMKKLRYFYMV